MKDEGILGLGLIKGKGMEIPRKGEILSKYGSGQGVLGLGIMNNVQERVGKILKR